MNTMDRKSLMARIVMAVLAALLVAACGSKPQPAQVPAGAVAVAPFMQPAGAGELLAGYIPEGTKPVEQKVLTALDERLAEALRGSTTRSVTSASITRQCQEIVTHRQKEAQVSPFAYWLQVGACVPTQYLLVPQLIVWEERQGGEWGVEQPATVVLDLYLIDVKAKQLIRRYHFDETQQSLSSNILKADKFFGRGGKWLTALDLSTEAITAGVKDLGL